MKSAIAIFLLLCGAAKAELITLSFNGSPVAVEMSASMPRNDTWSFGGKGTIVNEADTLLPDGDLNE